MIQPPHERVTSGIYDNIVSPDTVRKMMVCVTPEGWPDDDGPVTPIELWAIAKMREVPHGQVTFFVQDSEIVRCEKRISEKP